MPTITGTAGNDTLNGGSSDDILAGGTGADIINGGDGHDTLYSGVESPIWSAPWYFNNPDWVAPILDTGVEVDTLNGGAGVDRIYAGYGDFVDGGVEDADLLISLVGATSGVTVDFRSLDNDGTLTIAGGLIQNIRAVLWIEGTNFDDSIIGSDQSGFGSLNAPIFGLGGDDHIIAGKNTGNIYGGTGNDTIEVHQNYLGGLGYNGAYFGEAGDDAIVVTGDGTSYPYASASGGEGNDYLNLAGSIAGGAGNDTIIVADSGYQTTANGDEGNDIITDSDFSDMLYGGVGADVIEGYGGNDQILSAGVHLGDTSFDGVDRGTEHDEIDAGAGDDTIGAGYGDDVDGGTGFNGLALSLIGASAGVTINLASVTTGGAISMGGGTITNIQYLTHFWGTNFADKITLVASVEAYGMGGNDAINGTSGEDHIHGGTGTDIIIAGDGNDFIYFDALDEVGPGEQVNGGAGIDTLVADAGPAIIPDGAYFDISGATLTGIERISSQGGYIGVTAAQLAGVTTLAADLYFTTGGAVSLNGISAEFSTFLLLNDAGNQLDLSGFTPNGFSVVAGGSGADTVIGSASSDNIYAHDGSDDLRGGAGYDEIHGGQGDDIISGGADADSMTGGLGNDTFRDTAAGLTGDTITDFAVGDTIIISDANAETFTFNLTSSTLSYTGGSLTLTAPVTGPIVVGAAAGGGVQITIATIQDVSNDFNGDGRSDIMFRHTNGAITNFLGTANGGILNNGDNVYTVVDNAWSLAGTGDFNGDGRDDVLWRNDNGAVFNFLGTANGGVTNNGDNSFLQLNAGWTVSGVGDFNGDGRDDILFRDANGVIFDYLGTASGGFTGNTNNLYTDIADAWHVSGVGDFNGDGRDDILFRNDNGAITNFLGTANGGILNNGDNIYTVVGNDWHIAGVGDFNGDGRDDILWRNDNGAVFTFLGTANGGVINNGDNSYAAMSNVWHVEAIGDYDGDGRDDILWRHDNGTIIDWLGTASGGFTDNSGNLFTSIVLQWQVAPADALI